MVKAWQFDAGYARRVVAYGTRGVGGVAGVTCVAPQPTAALLDVPRRRRGVEPLEQRTDDARVAVPRIPVKLHVPL